MGSWFFATLSDFLFAVKESIIKCAICAVYGSTGYFLRQGILFARFNLWSRALPRWFLSAMVTAIILYYGYQHSLYTGNLADTLNYFGCFFLVAVLGYFGYFLVPGSDFFYPPDD